MGQQERVRQLLRLFEAENPDMVSVEYLDPFADPERFKGLRERIGAVPLDEGGCVVVEIGEGEAARRGFVRNYDMFKLEADESGRPDRVRTRFLGEGELTGALIRLTQGERPRVGFSTGHGEPSIVQMNPAAPGFGVARSLLEKLGMQVVGVNLARPIPAELSTLVIAAPTQELGADDLARIEKYMAGGGRLLAVLDGSVPSGMETWLEERGMKLGPGVVVDPALNFRRPVYPLVEIGEGDKSDPVVGPLVGKMILVPQPSPLKLDPSKAPSGRPRILLRTSPSSWAESEPAATRLSLDPRADTPGPIAVAATLADPPTRGTDRRPTPRAVVFSSRTLFDNETIAAAPTNFELLANALAWLERRQDLAGVPPRTYVARTLSAAPSLRAKLVLLPTLLSGAVIIGLGVATYIARRE
jgi:ABC-2 type transport system permease protein